MSNDLNVIEVPPLDRKAAHIFINKLLNSTNMTCQQAERDYLLDKTEWFIPFYLQLAVQELFDEYTDATTPVTNAMIDRAFANISKSRNNIYFEYYYSRLKKTFDECEYPFAVSVLKALANADVCTIEELKTLAEQHQLENYGVVLRALEFDGYLFKNAAAAYQFTSPILRQWWRNYVV